MMTHSDEKFMNNLEAEIILCTEPSQTNQLQIHCPADFSTEDKFSDITYLASQVFFYRMVVV